MNNLLAKFLKKKGVTEFSQLSQEEKDTYRKWDEILSGRKITDDEVVGFLESELNDIFLKLENPEISKELDLFLKMKLSFIRKIKALLKVPELEKKILENNLNQ